jgi:hypothetical protein
MNLKSGWIADLGVPCDRFDMITFSGGKGVCGLSYANLSCMGATDLHAIEC